MAVKRASASDPSVTHGKNGVPELPAQPEAETLPLHPTAPVIPEPRRCAGSPGVWTCEAVLGADVAGGICDHCAAAICKMQAQDVGAEEAFVDCDGCQPDRYPISGKLCGRCRARAHRQVEEGQREGAELRRRHETTFEILISTGQLSVPGADAIRASMAEVARFIDGEDAGLSPLQQTVFLELLRDFCAVLCDAHRAAAHSNVGPVK